MRPPALCAVLGTSLLVVAAPTADASRGRHKAAPTCRPPARSRVLLADAQAEVYQTGESPSTERGNIYGCDYAQGHSYYLGHWVETSSSSTSGIDRETLAGAIVAYESGSGSQHYVSWLIVVRDLSNGRVLHDVPTGTPAHPEPPSTEAGVTRQDVGIGPATAVAVKSDGAVAWIAQVAVGGGLPYQYQVHALDSSGDRVLAQGAEVGQSSLALVGSTLYWSEYGKPFSATLN
jgi:hypothetical protein